MKLKKLAALCKQKGTLQMVYMGSTLFAGNGTALYKLPSTLPTIHNPSEMMAVLGYTDKEADKLYSKCDSYASMAATSGICLEDAVEGERICDESKFDLMYGDYVLHGLECEDGTIDFIEKDLLAPLLDEIGGYTEFYRRKMSSQKNYYVVKNGMNLLAVILPLQVLNDDLAGDLEEMSNMVYRALGKK